MRAFGFLSFGHYGGGPASGGLTARQMLHDAIDISVGADELGVNGAYFRVHHFAPQSASPMPLLSAVAARTERIEVGTGVIDMRYENPLYLAEEAAALDLIADGRVALGISRGSPEPADRGWEAFGYTGSTDPRGADIAREKFDLFLEAIRGEPVARAAQQPYGAPVAPGADLRIEPPSPDLAVRIWCGAGSRDGAENVGQQGLTVLSAPRVSISRSVFPVLDERDALMFGLREGGGADQIGIIDGHRSTFGRTFVGEPDQLIEELTADAAVMSADTLMLTVPSQLGVELN